MRTPYSTNSEGSVKPDLQDEPTGNPDMLESRIMQVVSWGRILRYVAGTGAAVDACDLHVIADAIDTLGGLLHDDAEAFAAKHGGAL
ncbi:hypothetical protein [Methylorubrum thiocyanatum]|uniref:hypothetical protein n=1 Tax=Methylorubrum thiocyanatum TaxID=47958 RepID=UPI00365ED620